MGWTGTHAKYYKNGTVDRKAECDAILNCENARVLKSTMIGSIYYAAVETTAESVKLTTGERIYVELPEEEREIWAAIFLTSTDMKDYFNFNYKDMDETCGPCECDCPKGILDLLTPTEHEYANEWRNRCRAKLEQKKKGNPLNKLPIGSKVIWTRGDGTQYTLVKREPYAQFKTWWWQIEGEMSYVAKKRVTEENTQIVA